MCFTFINRVNAAQERNGLSLWILGQRHSQIYNWRCENTSANGERDISLEAGAEAARLCVGEQFILLVHSSAYQFDPEINELESASRIHRDKFLSN
jgi:hypothetical protein